MNIDFEDAEVIALNALEHARSLAPGAAGTEALKEAGKLRAAAYRLWENSGIHERTPFQI
jgi:hypothetical protein